MVRTRAALFGLLLFSAWSLQSTAAQANEARELFVQGRDALLAGRHAKACPLLAESYEKSRLLGVLFTLAECYRGWGKAHTALLHYQQLLDRVEQLPPKDAAKHEERVKLSRKAKSELPSRIPKLVIQIQGSLPDQGGVFLDGKDVTPSLGTPIDLDAGTHQVELRDGDGEVDQREVNLSPGATQRVLFNVESDGGGNPPPPTTDEWKPPVSAYVLGGIGIAGIVVGSATGIMTLSKKSEIDENCPDRKCNEQGREAVDSAQTTGLISTISFGVGLAALGGAAAVYFISKGDRAESQARAPKPKLRLLVGPSSLQVSGTF